MTDPDQLSLLPDLDRASDEIKPNENGICTRCGFQMLKKDMKNGLCAACYALLNPPKEENEDGWSVCPICNEKVGALCKSGLCVECDYKKEHPEAQKKICEDCVHFRLHQLYDENDHTECCCKLHLEGKNRHEWTYLCKDFVKVDSVQDFYRKYEGLMKYASYKGLEKCPECNKKFRFLYDGLCLPCYEKKRKKSEEIARGFIAEGWKEVPDNEKESAMYEQNGWIDVCRERQMTDQLSLLPMLDDAEHPTWLLNGKQGIQNDCGVYVENVFRFREGKLSGVNVEVSLCAEGNYILFEFDYSTGTYGCGHPLCRPCHECHRNNSAEFLAEIIFETFKNGVVPYDGNLTNYPKEKKELLKLCKRACDRFAKEIV